MLTYIYILFYLVYFNQEIKIRSKHCVWLSYILVYRFSLCLFHIPCNFYVAISSRRNWAIFSSVSIWILHIACLWFCSTWSFVPWICYKLLVWSSFCSSPFPLPPEWFGVLPSGDVYLLLSLILWSWQQWMVIKQTSLICSIFQNGNILTIISYPFISWNSSEKEIFQLFAYLEV